MNYTIKRLEDITILTCPELDEKKLFQIFDRNTRDTIYVVDEGRKLIGIITLGNFRRYILKGQELMNTSFSFVSLGNEEKALELLEQNEKISVVPIVDENHCICYEYAKVNGETKEEEWDFEEVIVITKEMYAMHKRYQKIYVMFRAMSEEQKNITDKITKKTEGGIIYLEDRKNENVFIVETDSEKYRLWELFYEKMNVKFTLLYKSFHIDNIKSYIKARISYYKKIAVLESSINFFRDLVGNMVDIVAFDMNDCVWDEEKECYVYMKELRAGVECLFTYYYGMDKPYIILGKQRILPIISIYYKTNVIEKKSSDADIAANIVPCLVRNEVRCILIRNPDEEYEFVQERFKENIELRNSRNIPAIFFSNDKDEGEKINEEYRKSVISIRRGGYLYWPDCSGTYMNYMNGLRNTVGNGNDCKYKLLLFGPCIVAGSYVKDEDTVASIINRKRELTEYAIYNFGGAWPSMNIILRKQVFSNKNMVIIFGFSSDIYHYCNLETNSIIRAYQNMPDVAHNVWNSLLHINAIGTRYVAEEICRIIKEKYPYPVDAAKETCLLTFGVKKRCLDIPPALERWFEKVKTYIDKEASNAGAIVMNCNPFTKGHRYLIETAAKSVDVLYIFVLEEDKSYFTFSERIRMVEMGTKDLENVVVIPSGTYMISTATLPGYFTKEEKPEIEFDATKDLSIFSEMIAPWFGIKTRFAGEEPRDRFTQRYNRFMEELLPQYGIQFVEIPRKEEGGEAISAKRVRELLKNKKYEDLKKLVPESTYRCLEEGYFS